MASTVADAQLLDSLVDPLWDALLRVRRQARKADTDAVVKALASARKEIRARIRRLNDRIELILANDQRLGNLRASLRKAAAELRDEAGRIRGVQSALSRAANMLRLADKVLDLLA